MNIQETDQQVFGQLTTEKLCTILNPNYTLSTSISVLFYSKRYEMNCKQKLFKITISKHIVSFSRVPLIGWKNKYQLVLKQMMKMN